MLNRFPFTITIMLICLSINCLSAVILAVANGFAKGMGGDAIFFALPLFFLIPISIGLLLIGGAICLLIDNHRFKKRTLLTKVNYGIEYDVPFLLIIGVLLLPTVWLISQLAPMFITPVWNKIMFATTASPREKLSREYAEKLGWSTDPKLITAYLDKGVDINLVGQYSGETALMVAVDQGNEEFVEALLRRGADVNYGQSETALSHAFNFQKNNPTFNETKKRIVEVLISHGADVVVHGQGDSVLNEAIGRTKDSEVIASMIAAGAPINGTSVKDKDGYCGDKLSPLMQAARIGADDIVNLLLERGADINAMQKSPYSRHFGVTALLWAIECNQFKTAKFLITKGADIHLGDINGLSAIELARTKDNAALKCALAKSNRRKD